MIRPLWLVSIAVLMVPTLGHAQWQLNGIPVSNFATVQYDPAAVSDGAGGAIVVWDDGRNGGNDIYAQRINPSGVPLWTPNGVAICTAVSDQTEPTIVSDGAGGAIITWRDNRGGTADIYAQRVNPSGAVLWTVNGVALCTATAGQVFPAIDSDGAAGAVVTWQDFRPGSSDVYAQRINASGVVLWAVNGVPLCTAANTQGPPTIVSDGAAGAIVSWPDFRGGSNLDIYVQRVNATGTVLWTANGVALCNAVGDQDRPVLASDGAGGAIVAWVDYRFGAADIFAQRVNASGTSLWLANGLTICGAANNQFYPNIVSDGVGGAIVSWYDFRVGPTTDIFAQRVSASGSVLWSANGNPLCNATGDQYYPTIATDGAAGAVVTWQDYRNVGGSDVYTQRIDASGLVRWTADGVALCTAPGEQTFPVIVSAENGSAIAAWSDFRGAQAHDIYAQRVEGVYGFWGRPDPFVTSAADIPNDQGGKVAVNWEASGRDVPIPATIDFYSVWRAVETAASEMVASSVTLESLRDVGLGTPPGARLVLSTSAYYWELVGTQTAYRWSNYSFSADTRSDSLAGDAAIEYFMVAAHDRFDEHIAFPSNEVAGYSVDNLAPAAPFLLTAQRVGADVNLHWNRAVAPDLRDYSVYRATSTGVTPVPLNFLTSSEDTIAVDPGAPPSALYYIVTAYDVHANQSDPSNEASVGPLTGIGNTPPITALTVLQNQPNPFTGTTELRVGLPANADISIEVYDVAGRRVRTQSLAQQAAGWRTVPFDGRDDGGRRLASGVYFYRVTANGKTVTNKMVIAR